MLSWIISTLSAWKERVDRARLEWRWNNLRARGLHLGKDVLLPADTWIDGSHCNLISIGDHCGFGAQCLILAHDAQMDEFLDAARLGKVLIHESCHFGARTIILPGVEVGPRTIVGAGSVVSRSLPPDTVCAGSPAKVICTLEEYLARHRERLKTAKTFDFDRYTISALTPERMREMADAVREKDAYIVGGRTAELRGGGATPRTPS